MKIISHYNKRLGNYFSVFCIVGIVLLSGCYSFTGGSVPEYLKTLYIPTVNDNSGYGDPRHRATLTEFLLNKFRSDGSFTLAERGGDARLSVSITSITDAINTVKPGELESEKKITVNCEVEYYDNVKKKQFWKKSFSNYGIYESANAQTARQEAIKTVLEHIADDILLSVISGW